MACFRFMCYLCVQCSIGVLIVKGGRGVWQVVNGPYRAENTYVYILYITLYLVFQLSFPEISFSISNLVLSVLLKNTF